MFFAALIKTGLKEYFESNISSAEFMLYNREKIPARQRQKRKAAFTEVANAIKTEEAKNYLDSILQDYPKSKAAKEAQNVLKGIK